MSKTDPRALDRIRRLLLHERTWRYLRYQHLREGLLLAGGVRTVLAVGAGKAYAELALAIEFPEIRFHVTDVESERTPNYQVAVRWARKMRLRNITFATLDIFDPPGNMAYDLVTSVEVLEHLEDDRAAAARMLAAARRYVFALVPFADEAAGARPDLRRRAWEKCEHYRLGYDARALAALFPRTVEMRGCYFRDGGHALRQKLTSLDDAQIEARAGELIEEARADVRREIPRVYPEALGIWTLARSNGS